MTKQEIKWFNELHEDRTQVAAVMLRPEFINVFNEAIDKYSESAHFLYELFQNADDAGATKAELILERDKLIFKHNGTTRFTVSDPKISPEEARAKGEYGHINSITSIGFSTKNERTGEGNKIGKFGVGFKAIFQYTDTPLIYDYNIDFRLDKYIIPTLLTDKLYSEKRKTVFVFPFNHPKVSIEKCYNDISSKIRSLEHPTLFLHNLKKITWSINEEKGSLECKVSDRHQIGDILAEKIAITDGDKKSNLWMFSRAINISDDGKNSTHNISVGIFLDKGKLNTKLRPKLYCFFKTNDSLHSCFIAHAPFALANNREQLKKDNKTNFFLIKQLCELMADSLECLRDIGLETGNILLNDNIVDIINIKESNVVCYWKDYLRRDNCLDCSDLIRDTLIDKVQKSRLLYCREGFYIDCEHAIWAPNDLLKLLTTKQLNYLVGYDEYYNDYDEEEDNVGKYWSNYREDDPEFVYHFVLMSKNTKDEEIITDILCDSPHPNYTYEDFGEDITNEFMSCQTVQWLDAFYKLIIKNRLTEIYQLNVSQKSSGVMRNRPIVKLENGTFEAPYKNGRLNIFYKSKGVSYEANYVNESLLSQCPGFTDLLKLLNVSVPDRLDYILSQVLPQYRQSTDRETGKLSEVPHHLQDFEEIFLCWHNSSKANADKLLEQVNKTLGLMSTDGNLYQMRHMIRPDEIVVAYKTAASSSEIKLLDIEYYKPLLEKHTTKTINDFFDSLCFQARPGLKPIYQSIKPEEAKKKVNISAHPGFTYSGNLIYTSIFGLEDYLITGHKKHTYSKELSHYVWELLRNYSNDLFKENAKIRYQPYLDYRYNPKYIVYPNPLIDTLQRYPWIYISKTGKYLKIKDLFLEDFIENGYQYDAKLMEVLQIISSPKAIEREQIQGMSAETQATFALGEVASECFENKDEMIRALELLKAEKAKQAEKEKRRAERQFAESALDGSRKKQRELKSSDFADVRDITPTTPNDRGTRASSRKNLEDTLAGFDEKAQTTRAELEEIEILRDTIDQSEKYSYIWFKSLMELESRSNGAVDINSGKKTIFLQFDEVVTDKKSDNILILKGCGRYIPTSIEDIEGINVTFFFRTGLSQAIEFEAASVKDNSVRLKISNYKLDTLDVIKKNINLISRAEINVDKPIQLIEKWKTAIDSLGFDSTFNLRTGLRKDIKFIFGPPGTGKTTELARQISELISNNDECKILVLAPTNKACDVLTRKLLDKNLDNDSWIWRFVSTMDSELDQEEVVYPRESDIMSQDQVCVISTMARLSFDGFNDWRLSEIEWDYIIIDEASMIPLYQIIYPIFHNTESQIIIAGDPFQIDPIVKIEEWANENIYTLVQLNDFKNPRTVPHQFEVQKLCTQYRSTPNVGQIYSKFAYGGILQHHRTAESRKQIEFGLAFKSLNIISFPTNKSSSLYEPKRLMMSNIHIYSVLFVAEFIDYIIKQIGASGKADRVSIGVISPYGAEVSAIDKLCQQKLKDVNSNIEISCGTAHGFQGDECDIVIVVMNPPASGMKLAKDKVFINKTNILNVAISRARDYVFMLIPDKDYQYFENMSAARRVGRLMFETNDCQAYTCEKLESIILGRERAIESSTFITSHQMTNVYSECDEKYEIRVDENSLDIQMNE